MRRLPYLRLGNYRRHWGYDPSSSDGIGRRLSATLTFASPAPYRMPASDVGVVVHTLPKLDGIFIRDSKSEGCWLAATVGEEGYSLAVLPPEACR